MAHRSDVIEIHRPAEQRAERITTGRIEGLQDLQMLLDQLRPRQSAQIEYRVVDRINPVGTDGNDDEAVTGQNVRDVIVPLKAGNGLPAGGTGPLQKRSRTLKAGRMPAVEENHDRKRSGRQIDWVSNRGMQLNRPREAA